jgi:hypothetical protein
VAAKKDIEMLLAINNRQVAMIEELHALVTKLSAQ